MSRLKAWCRAVQSLEPAVKLLIDETANEIADAAPEAEGAAGQAEGSGTSTKRVRAGLSPEDIALSLSIQVTNAMKWKQGLAETALVAKLDQSTVAQIVCFAAWLLPGLDNATADDLARQVAVQGFPVFERELGLSLRDPSEWRTVVQGLLAAAETWSALVQSQPSQPRRPPQPPQPSAESGAGVPADVGGAGGAPLPVPNPDAAPAPPGSCPDDDDVATIDVTPATNALSDAAAPTAFDPVPTVEGSADPAVSDAMTGSAALGAAPDVSDAKPPQQTADVPRADDPPAEATEQPIADAHRGDDTFAITPADCGLAASAFDALVAALQLSPAQRNHLLFTFCRLHTCASAVDTAQRFGIVEPAGFPLDQLFVPDSATAARLLERTLPSGSEPLVHEHFATKGPTDPYLKQWDVARRLVAAVPFDGGRKYVAFVLRVDGFVLAVGTKARSHEDSSFDSLPAEWKALPKIRGSDKKPYFVGPASLASLSHRVPLLTPAGSDGVSQAKADMLADILGPVTAFEDWAAEYELLGQKGAIATADIPGVARLLAVIYNRALTLPRAAASRPTPAVGPHSEQPAAAASMQAPTQSTDAPTSTGVIRTSSDRPLGPTGALPASRDVHVAAVTPSQRASQPVPAPAPTPKVPNVVPHPHTDLVARVQFHFRTESFAIPASVADRCDLNTLVVVEGDRNRFAPYAVDAGLLVEVVRRPVDTPLPPKRVIRPANTDDKSRRSRMDQRAAEVEAHVRDLQRTALRDTEFGRADVRACEFQLDSTKFFVHFYHHDSNIDVEPAAAAIRTFCRMPKLHICMNRVDGPDVARTT